MSKSPILHVATIDGRLTHASVVDGLLSDVANKVINHLRSHERREVKVSTTRTLDGYLREVEARHVVVLSDGDDEFQWVHTFKLADEPWPTTHPTLSPDFEHPSEEKR